MQLEFETKGPCTPAVLRRWWGAVLLLLVAVLLVYLPVIRFDFINYDDQGYVYSNPVVRQGLSADTAGWAFRSLDMCYWHPLTWLSHLLDVSLFGLWPGGHHLTSLLLHLFNTGLLIWLARLTTGERWPSLAVGALFALHPSRVEPVVWIAQRKDLVSTAFLLLALIAYARWVKTGRLREQCLLVGAFAACLMAKPMMVTLPFALLLLDRWPLKRYGAEPSGAPDSAPDGSAPARAWRSWVPPLRLWREKLPLWALTATFCVITLLAHQKAIVTENGLPFAKRIAGALVVYGQYLWQLFWPVDLSIFYPLRPELPLWQPLLAGSVLAAITAVFLARRRLAPFAVGWFVFLGMLVPVTGIVQFGTGSAADRFTYVPYVGLFAILTGAFTLWGRRPNRQRAHRRAAKAAAVILLAVLASLTFRQVGFWQNSHTVFARALELDPANAEAWFHLGDDYFAQARYPRAIACFQSGLQISPNDQKGLQNMAAAYLFDGQTEKAIATYRQVLKLYPGYRLARRNLGIALSIQASQRPQPSPRPTAGR